MKNKMKRIWSVILCFLLIFGTNSGYLQQEHIHMHSEHESVNEDHDHYEQASHDTFDLRSVCEEVLVFAQSLFSLPSYAAYEDGVECEFCGGWRYDDWKCDNGDHCGEGADGDCYSEHHCGECGECVEDGGLCDDCEFCFECCECEDKCRGCYEMGETVCKDCGEKCSGCAWVCDNCEKCLDCVGDELYCTNCDICFDCADWICYCGEGCSECALGCEDCNEKCTKCAPGELCLTCTTCFDCVGGVGDFCPECQLCKNCVEAVCACGNGCSECTLVCADCGEKCENCADGGVCGECGICFDCVGGEGNYCYGCDQCIDCVGAICAGCSEGCAECTELCPECNEKCMNCADDQLCSDCGICFDCVGGEGNYCAECGVCKNCVDQVCSCGNGCSSCAQICPECTDKCENCADDELCGECGICFECVGGEGNYCAECGVCKNCVEQVCICGNGCSNCAAICPDCGEKCENCADDEMCGVCGVCFDCVGGEGNYCAECGECKNCVDYVCICGNGCSDCATVCPDCNEKCTNCAEEEICGGCNICKDCAGGDGNFCDNCETCKMCSEFVCICGGGCSECVERICPECNEKCSECADDELCSECGICKDCAGEENFCADCGICYNCVDMVCVCGGGCSNCTVICPECGEKCENCSEGEICSECGVCVDCAGSDSFCITCGLCSDCGIVCPCGEGCENCADICPECEEKCSNCCDEFCASCDICRDCAGDFYCEDCGQCGECTEICEECGIVCADCAESVCEDCGKCSGCIDEFCPDCGICIDCAGSMCLECYYCSDCADNICEDCGEYCSDCIEFCDECGKCENCVTICPECELCEDCCAEVSKDMGCDHGICTESYEWKTHYCSDGGHCVGSSSKLEYDNDEHWTVCGEGCDNRLNSELHTFGEGKITKEATKNSEGVMSFSCTFCGFVREESIPKLSDDHIHEYTAIVTEPTCESGGYTMHTCECGHTYTDNQTSAVRHNYVHKHTDSEHWQECEYCGNVTEKAAHKMGGWTTTVKAGYTFDGEKQCKCKICEYAIKESIPATGAPGDKFVVVIPDYDKYVLSETIPSDDDSSTDITDENGSGSQTTAPSDGTEDLPASEAQQSGGKIPAKKELVTKGKENSVPSLPTLPPTEEGNQFDGWVNKETGEPVKKGDKLTENIEIEPVWKDCGEDNHTDTDEDNHCDECGYIMVKEVGPGANIGDEGGKTSNDSSGGAQSWMILALSCFGGVIAVSGVVLVVALMKKK